jgi:hypothetical protein
MGISRASPICAQQLQSRGPAWVSRHGQIWGHVTWAQTRGPGLAVGGKQRCCSNNALPMLPPRCPWRVYACCIGILVQVLGTARDLPDVQVARRCRRSGVEPGKRSQGSEARYQPQASVERAHSGRPMTAKEEAGRAATGGRPGCLQLRQGSSRCTIGGCMAELQLRSTTKGVARPAGVGETRKLHARQRELSRGASGAPRRSAGDCARDAAHRLANATAELRARPAQLHKPPRLERARNKRGRACSMVNRGGAAVLARGSCPKRAIALFIPNLVFYAPYETPYLAGPRQSDGQLFSSSAHASILPPLTPPIARLSRSRDSTKLFFVASIQEHSVASCPFN